MFCVCVWGGGGGVQICEGGSKSASGYGPGGSKSASGFGPDTLLMAILDNPNAPTVFINLEMFS